MKPTRFLCAVLALTLVGTVGIAQAAETDAHGGRPPTAGAGPQGGTGSKTHMEGTQAGAPGNIVTAAEGTVMGGHDVDADGFISKAEAAKNGDLLKSFAKLDANRDDKLDEKEFAAFVPSTSATTGTAPVNPADARKPK